MALKKSNHTQVPNDLLGGIKKGNKVEIGYMAELTGSTLKVILAVTRLTIGYHQDTRRASISMMQKLTGLSRQGVLTAAEKAEELDLITRYNDNGVTVWELNVAEDKEESDNTASLKIRPEESNNLTRGVQKLDQTGQKIRPPSKKETLKETEKKPISTPPEKQNLNKQEDPLFPDEPTTNQKIKKATFNPVQDWYDKWDEENIERLRVGLPLKDSILSKQELDLLDEIRNLSWCIQEKTIGLALIYFIEATRESGVFLDLPRAKSTQKFWEKEIAIHTENHPNPTILKDLYLETLKIAKGDENNKGFSVGHPGALTKTLPTIDLDKTTNIPSY